jgi:hypothetical protein
MQTVPIFAVIVGCAALAACALEKPEVDQVAQAKMIGLSKKAIHACLGPPDAHKTVSGTEIWAYESGTTEIEGSGFASFGYPRHPHCRVNIVMTNGVVSQINYAGPMGDSLDLGERCVFPVNQCAGP